MVGRAHRMCGAERSRRVGVVGVLAFETGQAVAVHQLRDVLLALRAPFLRFTFDGGAGFQGVLEEFKVGEQVAEQMGHGRLLRQDCACMT
ncbi:hypothetical protein DFI_14870 (plasmid) [Deinococcus ficus]|uniref:Uncharacterized protein n=1 Tax=Deinococcus ficus TaxID=317577 RepID=A0A221T0M9_9DEIO|nr:hypothetical protein DFI_14870 [Deinococcus ficus]